MPPLNDALSNPDGVLTNAGSDLLSSNPATAEPRARTNAALWDDPRRLQALADEVVALMKKELKLERQRLGRYRY
ncbi:MAG: hypothetical protein KJ077_20050 [Anaerolineae bacterium]|nr:hypothetical protein [Anaerolineae bacterium]